jgi:hypothetical protein
VAAILVGTGQPIGPLVAVVTISIAAAALWWYLMFRESASDRSSGRATI